MLAQLRSLLLAWLMAVLLVACSTSSTSPPPTSSAVAPSERTVLILWHAWPRAEAQVLAVLIERFNRTTPGVQIVLQTRPAATLRSDLALAVAEGGGPHVAIVPSHTLGGLRDEAVLLPAEDLIPARTVAQLLPVAVGAARTATADGPALYGVPLTFDTLALYYNRANFTGAPPSDLDPLLATARGLTVTSSNPPIWGLAYNLNLDRTLGYLYAFGGRVFDDEGAIILGLDGREGTEAWLNWLLQLREDPRLLARLDGVRVDNAVMAQQAVMTIDWAHALPVYQTIWPGNLGVMPLPHLSGSNQQPQPLVQSDVLVFNARLGEQAERTAASALATYLLDEVAQRELLRAGRQPVLLSLDLEAEDTDLDPELRNAAIAFRAQAQVGLPMPNSRIANEVVWNILLDMHSSVLRRLLTPEQAIEQADGMLRSRLETRP
ncbi:extracellular solute-binding protein [Candidatus Chloroploca sp. Khr17]|uniref:sugar ABC transporter substrate-binding protein n=1 Tax=Candidatus Chloroploca sp. Khr17 TaxID=2496869 RepID=UPI00101C386E|nr:extracellular solute-binding protein [Candidatus Chloroploca sp. Khr17]